MEISSYGRATYIFQCQDIVLSWFLEGLCKDSYSNQPFFPTVLWKLISSAAAISKHLPHIEHKIDWVGFECRQGKFVDLLHLLE